MYAFMPPKKKRSKGESASVNKQNKKSNKSKSKKRKKLSPITVSEFWSCVSDNQTNKSEAESSGYNNNNSNKTGQQTNTFISPEINQQSKRFHQGSPTYFDFGPYYSSGTNTMSMNF